MLLTTLPALLLLTAVHGYSLPGSSGLSAGLQAEAAFGAPDIVHLQTGSESGGSGGGGAAVVFPPAAASGSSTQTGCQELCINRYGAEVCCDETPVNSDIACPPMPRILVDCSDPEFIKREIDVKGCSDDSQCGSKEKCCVDSCDPTVTICMPGDRNLHFLFP